MRCSPLSSARGPATPCFSRRLVPALTSSTITSIAAARSSRWSSSLPPAGPPESLRKKREERSSHAAPHPTGPLAFLHHAGALPDRRGHGVQRLGGDGADPLPHPLRFLRAPVRRASAGRGGNGGAGARGLS